MYSLAIRPVFCGAVVAIPMLAVAIYVIASDSGPNKAIGLAAVAAVSVTHPIGGGKSMTDVAIKRRQISPEEEEELLTSTRNA